MEDCILDQLLSLNSESFNSLADAQKFVYTKLREWGTTDNDVIMQTMTQKLIVKIMMVQQSQPVPTGSKLAKLVHLVKETNLEDTLLVVYTLKEKVGHLTIKVPNLDDGDENNMKILSLLIEFACIMHGVNSSNLTLFVDNRLDKSQLTIAGSLEKAVNKMIASAKNSYGHWDGPDVLFKGESDFKCTPPGLLAAMRLLNSKDTLVRKTPKKQDSKKVALTAFRLQEAFNTHTGLKAEKSTSFTVRLVKAILSSAVKPHNRGFPGGFIHSNRARNNVKSDTAVLAILGWTPKVFSQTRLDDVLFNTVDTEEITNDKGTQQKRTLKNMTKENRSFSHQEFRTALTLVLRKVNPNLGSFDEQIKKDSLANMPPAQLELFTEKKTMRTIDLLQQTYAIKVACNNPKSKSSLVHYENSRNALLASTANSSLVDSTGTSYKNFSSIPTPFQEWFRKRYRYPIKRKEPEASTTTADVLMADARTNSPAQQRIPGQEQVKAAKKKASATAGASTRHSTRGQKQNK